jgi:hypothetical protein
MISLRSLDAFRAVFDYRDVPADAPAGAVLYWLAPITEWRLEFDGDAFAASPIADESDAAARGDFVGLLLPDGRVVGPAGEWTSLTRLNEHLRSRVAGLLTTTPCTGHRNERRHSHTT